jgi:AraC-like DNA-binding protein
MPFSAGVETKLQFDGPFVQRSVRLSVEKLETVCARWLGHPLQQPLRFSLRTFSDHLEAVWQRTLSMWWSCEDDEGLPLASATKAAFDEFLFTLLLHQHPHNYSEQISEEVPVPVPGIIRRAERFMADNADASITISMVAAELGISVRVLQIGFRQWRSTTPSEYLRRVRLQRVRAELLRGDENSNVTTVALRWGFMHLSRFSAYYRATFNESPNVTLRRGRGMHT